MALPAMNVDFLFEKDLYTEEEYFALEDSSRLRWEFAPNGFRDERGNLCGVIRAMSGGTSDHSALSLNCGAALATALRMAERRGCRPFNSDLKVHCPDGRNTYPDVSVVCGPPEYYLDRRDIILNPILVAEVLSPGTESDDRGDKWKSYQNIPGLQYYLLLSPERIRVELYSRNEAGWSYQAWDDAEGQVSLPALEIVLQVADLYADMDWDLAHSRPDAQGTHPAGA